MAILDHLPDSSHEQEISSTHFLDQIETREGGGYIDGVRDHLNDEWVLKACVLEVLRSLLEVNTTNSCAAFRNLRSRR